MKQAVYFAGACAGIVLWHLPTTAACFARTVEGSYTCSEGGAVPAPMHSARSESVPSVPVVFGVERVPDRPTSTNAGALDGRDTFGPFTGPYGFASVHEPLVEPR